MRARLLRPEFFVHERLCERPALERLLFEGLWCLADREGRLEDRPGRIKVQVLPWDTCDVNEMLAGLAHVGSIVRYEVDGKRYLAIPSFTSYQKPHHREPASVIPAPCHKKPRQGTARPRNGTAQPAQASNLFPTETVTGSAVSPVTGDGSGPLAGAKREPTALQLDQQAVLEALARATGKPAKFDGSDYAIVGKILKTFSRKELIQAADGVPHDPWPGRKTQDGPAFVFGSASQVRKFMAMAPTSGAGQLEDGWRELPEDKRRNCPCGSGVAIWTDGHWARCDRCVPRRAA